MASRETEILESVLNTKNTLIRGDENGVNPLMGNGDVFIMTPTVKEMAEQEAVAKVNNAIEETKAEWEQKLKDQEEHAKEIDEKMKDMEIVPINSYVLVQPFKKNPFMKLKQVGSFVLPEYEGRFKNPDSGVEDYEDNLSVQATVVEVSPLCKFVKEGDVVYYRKASGVPVPFFGMGFEVIAEQQIQVVINSGLKERFSQM